MCVSINNTLTKLTKIHCSIIALLYAIPVKFPYSIVQCVERSV